MNKFRTKRYSVRTAERLFPILRRTRLPLQESFKQRRLPLQDPFEQKKPPLQALRLVPTRTIRIRSPNTGTNTGIIQQEICRFRPGIPSLIRPTLQDIDVVIREGEMLSIVGKNGAGKTTLASLMCGFIKPDAGVITMEGKDLAPLSISERAEYIGIVMQNPNQMISKTMIFDEVALGLKIRGMKEEGIKEKVYEVLQICGLYEFRNWPISALSFGQKKRVTIASILVLNPKVLILDEPTAGQDYRHYSEIMEFLRKLNENGQTIILITHDMHLMLEYTTRAIVISDSKKIADQKAFQVLCDSELVEAANLKETSLFELAKKAGISDPLGFVECFIHYDREVREHEN